MSTSNEIVLDDDTFDKLDAIAKARTNDTHELFKLTDGDLTSLVTFINDMGFENDSSVKKVLDALQQAHNSAQNTPAHIKPESSSITTKVAKKPPTTKAETLRFIAERTGLSQKSVNMIFVSLKSLIHRDLKPGGPGIVTIPGLVTIKLARKPMTKARKGTNPFTGEPMLFKAKAAQNIVKITPLKKLKDMV